MGENRCYAELFYRVDRMFDGRPILSGQPHQQIGTDMLFFESGLLKMANGPFELCLGNFLIEALAVVEFHCFQTESQGGKARFSHEQCGL